MSRLRGVGVSPGTAAGPVVRVTEQLAEPESGPAPAEPDAAAAAIRPAADAVAQQLFQRAARVGGDAKTVLETTAAMALDPALLSQAEQRVAAGLPAPRAVYEAANGFADALRAAGDYLAERVRDVQDVRDRIVAELLGQAPPGVPELDAPSVLLARDLAPADTAALNPDLVLALVTEEGGPTSHTAILARSLGIPAVVAVRGLLSTDGVGINVDGDTGEVRLSPEPVQTHIAAPPTTAQWEGTGRTADGNRVKILANVGSVADARAATEAGAEGVGLFRTEFCYLDAPEEPSVETQRAAYAEILSPFAGKPVVVRTLDAGADKPLPFLRMGAEPNPALGIRGLRTAFDNPELLDRQLTAIAAAATDIGAETSIMAPMVATPEEAAWFTQRVRANTGQRAGVMIEIPAAAMCAAELLEAVDFVSIGTNDLAQYLFAADRMTGALAELNDPWQPALLRTIAEIGQAGERLGKPVGVCGEAAADPRLGGVLTGLGVTSLSMAGAAVPGVGAELASRTLPTWREAAREALRAPDAIRAREVVRL